MGDRAVYCARLESVCTERYRGFESPPIRVYLPLPLNLRLLFLAIASLQNLEFLPQFHDVSVGQDAPEINVWINETIPA